MTGPDRTQVTWRKSSRSTGEEDSDCVEVAYLGRRAPSGHSVTMRDSKNPSGPHLHFTAAEWSTFLTTAKQT